MARRFGGSRISANVATASSQSEFNANPSSGVWSLQQMTAYKAVSMWPGSKFSHNLYSWGGGGFNVLGNATRTARSKYYPSDIGVKRSTPAIVGGDARNVSNAWKLLADGYSGWHMGGIKNDGTLWMWGRNQRGQIGNSTTTNYTDTGPPYYTPFYSTYNPSSPTQVGALTNWGTLSVGGEHTGSVKTNNTLWMWGRGNNGQLASGATANINSPTQVGALTNWSSVSCGRYHTASIKTDGTLWVWGQGANGRLGLGNITSYSSPKQVGALTTWSKVSAGKDHTAAIKTDGTLWIWGNGGGGLIGKLGLGNTTSYSSPKQVGALTTWASVAAGSDQTAAIKTDGTLWVWGSGANGTLGLGNTTNYSSPKQVGALTNWTKVSLNTSVVAIKTDGTLWVWGINTDGILGLGNTTTYSSPKQVGSGQAWKFSNAAKTATFGLKG